MQNLSPTVTGRPVSLSTHFASYKTAAAGPGAMAVRGAAAAGSQQRQMLELEEYRAPDWAQQLHVPTHRYSLGIFPTPLHRWHPPGMIEGCEVHIKRDDLSGMQLSGNKVRKLEFLMAAAKAAGHDCVITIGGIQSNHCRATAVAARYLGMDCHLILRNSRQLADSDPGLTGNLLLSRMVGAHIHQCTKEEYTRVGSVALGEQLAQQLRGQGLNPCVIPVGGSNSLGCWGYLEAVRELQQQTGGPDGFDDIVMACGSGGTTAGLALGLHLSGSKAKLHSFGVCDDPDYFYNYVQELIDGMGAQGLKAEQLLSMIQAKGSGYAMSTEDELESIRQVALQTGIVLDPVYSGKAFHYLVQHMRKEPEQWKGRRVVFLHTGGLFGMYDKTEQLLPLLQKENKAHRLQVSKVSD